MFLAIAVIFFIAFLFARYYESGNARAYVRELHRVWSALGVSGRIVMCTLVVTCTLSGGAKGITPVASLFRMIFWPHGQDWALATAYAANSTSAQAVTTSTNAIAVATNTAAQATAYVASNNTVTLSFDWHSPNRLPYHDRQNVLGRTVMVAATNIGGTLYEDHYVAFNEIATTNPAVILIEYARKLDDGTVERYSARTITNSYPVMVPVNLQSGSHTCYWFRCEVPIAFTNAVRDWSGEVLFGAPQGSGKGFDLLGTMIVDDGDNVWEGATTNMVINGITNSVKNGLILEAQ
jgi:hypothetical protein